MTDLSEPFEDAEFSAPSYCSTPWSGLITITADASCRG